MNISGIICGMMCLAIQTAVMGITTAEFTPQGPTTVSPGTPVTFSINLIPGLASYNNATIIIGTNAAGIYFEYDDDWINHFSGVSDTYGYMIDTGIYEDEHDVSMWSSMWSNDAPITNSLILGTVTLYTDGLANTSCWVKIDYDKDECSLLNDIDFSSPIFGYAEIVITPEPGTMMLLGFSFLYGLKLRRSNSPVL